MIGDSTRVGRSSKQQIQIIIALCPPSPIGLGDAAGRTAVSMGDAILRKAARAAGKEIEPEENDSYEDQGATIVDPHSSPHSGQRSFDARRS